MTDWHTTMLAEHLILITGLEEKRDAWKETLANYSDERKAGWLPEWFVEDGKTLCKKMIKGFKIQIKAAKEYIGQCENHKDESDPMKGI